MDIRIRMANEAEGRVLADIPFRSDVIDRVIPTLGGWGVVGSDGNIYGSMDLTGQFVDDGTEAYFEVVIGADD